MNILFVNDKPFNPRFGGIERVTDLIVRELLNYGYNIYYLSGRVLNAGIMDYDYPAKVYLLPEHGFFTSNVNKEYYKKILAELKIDIVINQRGTFDFMDCVLGYGDVKTISVVHSVIDSSVICYFHSRQETLQWKIKNFVKQCINPLYVYIKKKQLYKGLYNHYKELVQKKSTIVVLSNSYANDLYAFLNPIKPKVRVIGNPCVIHNEIIDYNKKEKIILFVGRLCSAEKQPIRLVQVWNRLYKQHPDWKLVFVGDGPARSQMEKYIKKHDVPRVFFEGSQNDVAEYYRKASFVCLTSNYEGWGMTLTEGMSYGCIPVTFNSYGAATDIVDDGVNGCLVSPFSIEEYACRLSELMSDAKKREDMATEALKKVRDFELKNVVDKWKSLIDSLS